MIHLLANLSILLTVQFEQKNDDISVLELNVTLPETDEKK